MSTGTRAATLDDLLKVDGKAELIAGWIANGRPLGRKPARIVGRICRILDDYSVEAGQGEVFTSTVGYAVDMLASGRQSFSPDASYFLGPFPENDMRFLEGPPTFAVEVRSENDYGDAAETAINAKRTDYFEAGTLVVWDVDPVAEVIRCYRADSPDKPVGFSRGDVAVAELAVPGWRVGTDDLFA